MSGILFLCHRFPFPPNKGDKIRSYHFLKHLLPKHDVYLGTLVDDPNDWSHVNAIRKRVKDICVVERRTIKSQWFYLLSGFLTKKPLTNSLFQSPQLQLWVDSLIQSGKIHAVFVFSSTMAQYVLKHHKKIPIITDFVDVDSQKWKDYSERSSFFTKWLYQLESKRLARFEYRVAQKSRVSLLVSDAELELFKATHKGLRNPIVSVQNGVDTSYFNPYIFYPNPYFGEKHRIVFTGLMDYWPNIEAVRWFVKEVFNPLLQRHSDLEFYIVGANPTKQVFTLSQQNIIVTGRVPDIRPYIKHADIIVAPLRMARGVQNKVLEAMSMNKIIVASPQALEGILLPPEPLLFCEETAAGFRKCLTDLLVDKKGQAKSHDWIACHYSWSASTDKILQLLSNLHMKERGLA